MAHHHHHEDVAIKNLKTSFALNASFMVIEFISAFYTNSTALFADAVHDLGDAFILMISILLTIYSTKKISEKYTYGYKRFSNLGALLNTAILMGGSLFTITYSLNRLAHPVAVKSNLMLVIAVVGVIVNVLAMSRLRNGKSIMERSVMLHLLEDVLGWIALLVTSFLISKTGAYILDPALSLVISTVILIGTFRNLIKLYGIFMLKVPKEIDIEQLNKQIIDIDSIIEIDELKLWSIDGSEHVCTMKIKILGDGQGLKAKIYEITNKYNISEVTIEILTNRFNEK